MHKKFLFAVVAPCLMMPLHSAVASGPSIIFTCEKDGLTRIVEAQFSEGGSAPCEVIYKKIDEAPGMSQQLWTSRFSTKFCIDKLDAFVEKQRGWGWACRITELGVLEQARD